ncbi:uncharacterized protein Triagg1_8314 [Trichoderma aggressivum f. europaeum]|uniref:Uncharacterized protein n=1 Tax=Trichoderma aggressivum f. europaeum TaxID=173218 RepID=A0AAE1ICA6_9HYPO|nr:hypothetical protein Triagg1_8314 [Trichoderma aggressivum f. europaeum]
MSSSSQQPPPPEAQHQESQQTVPPPAVSPVAMQQQQQQPGFQPYVYAATNPPVVSYVPYPGPQPTWDDLEPVLAKPWEITKTVLHVLSVLLAATGIGLGFSSLNFTYFAYTVVISAAPPCIIAVLWSLVELIVRAARKFQKDGIHPGAHIALSLIIFLVATVLTSLFGPWFQDSWGVDFSTQNCGDQWNSTLHTTVWSCTDTDDDAAEYMFRHERSVSIAVAVVTYLLAAIHFSLFVGACVDTSRVNSAASRPIYVIAQPQMMQQGWQPIPQIPIQPPPPVQQPVSRDVAPTEGESRNKRKDKGKGKGPALNNIEEQNEAGGSQS